MPKAAPAAGTGTPVAGDHSNAIELSSAITDDDVSTPLPDDLGSHREDDVAADEPAGEDHIDEAAIPARLKGKPLSQVYKEFAGLEKNYSVVGNELGEARKLLRMRLEQDLKNTGATSKDDAEPDPTDDDFDANPRDAVRRMVKKATEPLEKAVATAEQRATMIEFDKRHPGYQTVAASSEFQEWVKSSPFRVRVLQAASNFDVEAAEDLFSEWEARTAAATADADEPSPADQKRATIRRNRTETGGAGKSAGGKGGKPIFKSTELMRLYNTDRERYNSMSEEIRSAFAEGRVR